jgi:hypothetical protein
MRCRPVGFRLQCGRGCERWFHRGTSEHVGLGGDWFNHRFRFGRGLGRHDGLLGRSHFDDRHLDDRLLDDLASQPLAVGQPADAIGERVVDARRVALDADLQALAQVEHDLVLDTQFPRELINPDLLRGQSRSRLLSSLSR